MGNCVRKEPATEFGSEDWVYPASSPEKELFSGEHSKTNRKGVVAGDQDSGKSFSSGVFSNNTVTTEVKIKITRKQLEELLGKTDVQGLTVQQVLAQLINVADQFESHQRSWRPALQSIPE